MIEPLVVKKILRAFENKDVGTINSSFLQQGINPNTLIPSKGVSLLHLIIGHQSENFAFKITKLFLRCGGDPNVQSSDGVTPTHVAAGWGRNRILHLLLVNGGDPWMQDDEKRNAFNYAFEEREWNTIEMLHHFQLMHSAANYKPELENPKFKLALEGVLLNKGEEMIARAPIKNFNKSTMTQTQSYIGNAPSSPVQEKIKYFEPNQNSSLEINCWKKPEKSSVGWSKDIYQTSCEVIIHGDSSREYEDETKKKKTFVSSIHIDPDSNSSDSTVEKPVVKNSNSSAVDVRDQLFVELQEAVRRRSKLKIAQNEENSPANGSNSKNSARSNQNSPRQGVSFEENHMLKSMSDFATRVMDEIEASQGKTGKMADSSSNLTDGKPNLDDATNAKSIQTFATQQSNSDSSNLYLTPDNLNLSLAELGNDRGTEDDSNMASFVSVSEQFKQTDVEVEEVEKDEVIFLEKKLLVTPTISYVSETEEEEEEEDDDDEDDDGDFAENENVSVASYSPEISGLSCDSDHLRWELISLGYNPGPITKTTKKLYVKKLKRLKEEKKSDSAWENRLEVHSSILERSLRSAECLERIESYRSLEEEMCRSFENWTKRKWREGTNRTSFNYLLLDPRISSNLPGRAREMTSLDTWKCFLSSIFYVGKGKRSRPHAHLHQAAAFWEKGNTEPDEKIARIAEIWKEGLGVVCLQVFQNVIPVEALTREAAMIDALGLSSLKNARLGEYYGIVSTWSAKEKRKLGTYLLRKASLIFLNEGERQIKPYDID